MKKKLFYGWVNLAVAWLTYCITLTTMTYSFGIIGADMADFLGIGLTLASGGFTAYQLVSALSSPLAGKTIGKIGPKKTMLLGCGMLTVGALLMAFAVKGIFLYYFVYAFIISFSMRCCAVMAPQSLMTRWFFVKRSFAMALILTAGGVGGYIFTPVMRSISLSHGWQGVWIFQAICAGVSFLLVLLLIRDDPEKMGQLVDNGETSVDLSKKKTSNAYKTRDSWKLNQALRQPAFYALVLIALSGYNVMTLVSNTGINHMSTLGINPDKAAMGVGYFALINVAARLIAGYLADRINMKWCIFVSGVMGFAGCLLVNSTSSAALAVFGLIITGIGYAVTYVTPQTLIADYFGVEHFADISGFFIVLTSGVSALSPLLIGMSFDLSGSYHPSWIAGALFFGISSLCALLLRPPRKSIEMQRNAEK